MLTLANAGLSFSAAGVAGVAAYTLGYMLFNKLTCPRYVKIACIVSSCAEAYHQS